MLDFRKELRQLALSLALILAIAWSPYLFFGKTFLASASDVPSAYPTGAQAVQDRTFRAFRSLDSGAPGWQNEPWLGLEHHLIFDEHVLPMWDPNDGYGIPFAAAMVPQPFYPLTLAVSVDPTPWTYNLLIVGRLYIVALGCALFVGLFAGFIPALVAGICAGFSGYFLGFAAIMHIGVEAMLPWILLGVELVVRQPGPRNATLLAAALGMSLLGGMPESSAVAAISVSLYTLFRLILERRDKQTLRRIAWLASGVVIGTAIGGVMLVPFVELLHRDSDSHQAFGSTGLVFDPFVPERLLTEFAPLALGPPFNPIVSLPGVFRGGPGTFAIFFSLLASITAITAYARRTLSDRVALFLVLLGIGFEAKRFGAPFVEWIGSLPLFDVIGIVKYGEADIAVCFACAAGLGVAAVLERRVGFWQLWSALAIVLATVVWLYSAIVLPPGTKHAGFLYFAYALLLAVLASSAALAARVGRSPRASLMRWGLVSVALFEGAFAFFIPLFYVINAPASDSRNPYAAAPFVAYLQQATKDDGRRVMATGALLFPDWSSAYGLFDVRALGAMYPSRYLKFVDAFVEDEPVVVQDLSDRFTGSAPIDFDNPLVQRWMKLSSITYLVRSDALPPKPNSQSILADIWGQNKAGIPPARALSVRLASAEIDGVAENVLWDNPLDDTIAYKGLVPAAFPWFAVDVALDPGAWKVGCGGPVSFAVDARDANGKVVARAVKTIDPKHRAADRHWKRLTLDLRAIHAGGASGVTLKFATSVPSPGDECGAWAIWGEPRWTPVKDVAPYKMVRHQNITEVPAVRDVKLFHVTNSLGRLSLFHAVQPAADGDDALHLLTKPGFDVERTVVVEGPPPPASGSAQGDAIAVVERGAERTEAEVTTTSNAVLLQNDTWYPGWHATVDGIETPILQGDYLFRAIAIPAGHHRVVIEYRSRAVALGLSLTIAGLFACAVLLAVTPAVRQKLVGVYSTRRAKA